MADMTLTVDEVLKLKDETLQKLLDMPGGGEAVAKMMIREVRRLRAGNAVLHTTGSQE